MAISLVGYKYSYDSAGGNVTLNLTSLLGGGTIAQNDIVLVVGGHPDASVDAGVSTSGYTEILDINTQTGVRFSASWKRMGASPDTSVTGLGNGNGSHGTAYTAYVFRGVDTTTAIDATSTTATGSTGDPNSPSITTVTNNAIVVSAFVQRSSGVSSADEPTGYATDQNWICSLGGTVRPTAGQTYKAIATAGAENPVAWTLDNNTTAWVAASIALRPSAASFGDGALSSTGSGTATFVGGTTPSANLSTTGTATVTFVGNSLIGAPLSATGSGAASFVGTSISSLPQPFSMTGTVTASFVGALAGAGGLATTAVATVVFAGSGVLSAQAALIGRGQVQWIGATSKMESVREDIRSRGAATVNM